MKHIAPLGLATGCNPPGCVDVSNLMPSLHIPTGFVGETTDAMGGLQPCAPAADNYQTFYAGTNAPSLAVTVLGANHMSSLDDVASCGFTCNFCQAATAPNALVVALANAFVVAFHERHLRGNAGYDNFLIGAEAQARGRRRSPRSALRPHVFGAKLGCPRTTSTDCLA